MKLPGELVHFSLESSQGKTTQRVGTLRSRMTWNIVWWHTASFSPKSLPTLVQSIYLLVAQGARTVDVSLGPLQMLWTYCQTRNQATLREVEEPDFFILHWRYLMSLYSKFWAPRSEITGFLKGSGGDWVTGSMLVANRWAHTGVRDPRLFK
jgi:hypothetical protein